MVEPAIAQRTAATRSQRATSSREERHSSHHALDTAATTPAISTLQRLQALADASPRVAQLQRIQALADGAVQRLMQRKTPEEEELLQGRFTANSHNPSQRQAIASSAVPANRTGMPDGLKNGIEALSGLAMDHVRVHYNSAKPAQLNAHAYAQGSEIHLAPGQDHHLPHEAWHLVQQAQGRVQPTLQRKGGVAINDDPSLEREADQMGERAMASGR
jgi:hypothetical protein